MLLVVGGGLLLGCGRSQQGRVPQPGQRRRSGWCGKRSNWISRTKTSILVDQIHRNPHKGGWEHNAQ